MAKDLYNRKQLDELYAQLSVKEGISRYNFVLRNELQTGDLIFLSGNHWFSRLIQWRSKSAWSHVGMVLRVDEIERTFLIESVIDNGVRLIPVSSIFSDYDGDGKSYKGRVLWARHRGLTIEDEKVLRESSIELLTKQYDGKEFLRIAWRSVTGREKLLTDDKFTCAELVHYCFLKAKIRLNYDRGFFISPGSVWRNEKVEMMGILL